MKKYILIPIAACVAFVGLYKAYFQTVSSKKSPHSTQKNIAQKQIKGQQNKTRKKGATKISKKSPFISIKSSEKNSTIPAYILGHQKRYEKYKHLSYNQIKELPKYDRPDLAALHEFAMTADPKLGYPPVSRKLDAYYQIKKILQHKQRQKAIAGVNWIERGPNNYAGRTRAIMFDPNDATAKKVWAGSIGGGLWVNNDVTKLNSTWTPVNDFLPNIAISTLAYDPNNKQTFYMGTGLGFTSVIRGAGIWKSTDGGANWSQISSTNNSDFHFVQKIVVTSTSTILAATGVGLMRSTDGGTTWTKVLNQFAADIEIASDGVIYASQGQSLPNQIAGSVHKSIDDGQNWSDITPKTGGFRIEIAVAPSNPNILYAVADAATGGNTDVAWFVKSINGGATWSDVTLPLYRENDGKIGTHHYTRGQAFFNLILSVHPQNPDIVLAGGIDMNRSVDGGATWAPITDWRGTSYGPYSHADHHNIIFRPGYDDQIINGTDGGVFLCRDISATLPFFEDRNLGYNVTTFYSVSMANEANSNYILAGAQDNGSIRINDVKVGLGRTYTGGDGMSVFVDQDNTDINITSFTFNSYLLTTNRGKNFVQLSNSKDGRFVNPAEYDSDANILYAAGDNNVLKRMKNIGATTPGSPETLTFNFGNTQITTIKASPHTANRLFVGVEVSGGEARLFRIDNADGTNPSVSDITGTYTGNHGSWVSSIDVGASDNQLIATFSNYGVKSVYETTDGGTKWTDKSGNLPDMPIRGALYNPDDIKQVLLATEMGVWSTDDLSIASPVWEPTNTNLANVRCDMLRYRTSDKMVAVATYGRGVFTTNVFATAASADFSTKQTVAYVGVPVKFTDNSHKATTWSWNFGDGSATATTQNPSHTYTTAGTYTVSLSINSNASTKSRTNYITVLPARATPYTLADGGNFEVNQGDFLGKSLVNDVNIWELGTPGGDLNKTSSGTNAWKTGLSKNIEDKGFDYVSALYTPGFNFTNTAGAYKLKFKKSIQSHFCNAPYAMQVEYSTDGGEQWQVLGDTRPAFGAVNWYNFGSGTACPIERLLFPSLIQMGWNSTDTLGFQNQKTEFDVSFLKGNGNVSFRFVVGVVFGSPKNGYKDGFLIDDFEIEFSPPTADFDANQTYGYANQDVQFNYRSSGATSFSWDFGDGSTAATTENPRHKYTAPGSYNVTLTVNGSTSNTRTGYITILPSKSSNYGVADGGNFDVNTTDFAAENIKNTKFERGNSSVSGKDGTASGNFAWVTGLTENRYQDSSEARLYTPLFDFSSLGAYKIEFKAKYSFEATWDGFIVQYSVDQGKTWLKLNSKQEEGWYNQISAPQAIFGNGVPIFSGNTNGAFVTYSADVSFLGGTSNGVAFRFLFLTDQGTRDKGLALDDFILTGPTAGTPVPDFTASGVTGCDGQTVTFTSTSTGTITSLKWDFGVNASPRTITGIGPHTVVYKSGSTSTTNTVALTANGNIVETKTDFVSVSPTHIPAMTTQTIDVNTVLLTASSGDSYQWYKDGVAINGATNKTYQATVAGQYSVEVNIGGCKMRTTAVPTSVEDTGFSQSIKTFPNPSKGKIVLELNSTDIGTVLINVTDLSGRQVHQQKIAKPGVTLKETLDLSNLKKGIYLLEISTSQNKGVKRIMID